MDWPGILKTGTGQLKTDYPAALAFEKAGVTTYVVCNFGPRGKTGHLQRRTAGQRGPMGLHYRHQRTGPVAAG